MNKRKNKNLEKLSLGVSNVYFLKISTATDVSAQYSAILSVAFYITNNIVQVRNI